MPVELSRLRRRRGRKGRVIVAVLFALLMLMVRTGAGAPAGAMPPAAAEHGAHAPGATNAHDQRDGHGHKHKPGAVAVAISVVGIIVVVSLIVLLGSLSVRRRMRNTGLTGGGDRGPPERKWGMFS
jgi:hypothetical protein